MDRRIPWQPSVSFINFKTIMFAKYPETQHAYLMINAHNNPVQWKMVRRFPGLLVISALVTTERDDLPPSTLLLSPVPDGFRELSLVKFTS